MSQIRSSGLIAILLFAAALLLVHAWGGHVHADVLAGLPVDDHAAGDGHHEDGSASCEGRQSGTSADAVPVVLDATSTVPVFETTHSPARHPAPRRIAPLALFLLHAALLI